jgi:hypothetical protein
VPTPRREASDADSRALQCAAPAQPQAPATHEPVQQSPSAVHVAPTMAQLEGPVSQRSGFPAQVPAQHSSLVVHAAPAATHADVHTATPLAPAVQLPSQHVSSDAHGAPRGRHWPGPNSHRPLAGSHSPQHAGMDPPVHDSPVWRQIAGASVHTPRPWGHSPEQQSLSTLQGVPSSAQSAVPQVPELQPSEQQSVAAEHGAPFTTQ